MMTTRGRAILIGLALVAPLAAALHGGHAAPSLAKASAPAQAFRVRTRIIAPGALSVWASLMGQDLYVLAGGLDSAFRLDSQAQAYSARARLPPDISFAASAPGGAAIYVGSAVSAAIYAMDLRSLLAAWAVGLPPSTHPGVLAVDPDGRRAYLSDYMAPKLYAVDLKDGRLLGSLPLSAPATVMAIDSAGHRLYVGTEAGLSDPEPPGPTLPPGTPGRIDVVDTRKWTRAGTIPVRAAAIRGLAWTARDRCLYALSYEGAVVSRIPVDSPGETTHSAFVRAWGQSLVCDPDGMRVYVSEERSHGYVAVLDARSLVPLGRCPAGGGNIVVGPERGGWRRLFVTSSYDALSLVDVGPAGGPETAGERNRGVAARTVDLGSDESPSAVLPLPDRTAVIASSQPAALRVVEIRDGKQIWRVPLTNDPSHIAWAPAVSRILALSYGQPRVMVVDTRRRAAEKPIALPFDSAPYCIAADPGTSTAYVGNRDKGVLYVLDAAAGRLLKAVRLPAACYDLLVDPKRHRLYASLDAPGSRATPGKAPAAEETRVLCLALPGMRTLWSTRVGAAPVAHLALDPATGAAYVFGADGAALWRMDSSGKAAEIATGPGLLASLVVRPAGGPLSVPSRRPAVALSRGAEPQSNAYTARGSGVAFEPVTRRLYLSMTRSSPPTADLRACVVIIDPADPGRPTLVTSDSQGLFVPPASWHQPGTVAVLSQSPDTLTFLNAGR